MMRLPVTASDLAALRALARALAVVASLIFVYLAFSQGPPEPPEGPGIERDVQYVFVVVGVFATYLAWNSPVVGGSLMLVTGLTLGVLASMRFSEDTALMVALLYVVPSTLFLAVWALRRPVIVLALTLAVAAAAMLYGGNQAQTRHARAFGPAHPDSGMAAEPFQDVEWVWSGGVTSRGAEVRARVIGSGGPVRAVASKQSSFDNPVYSAPATPNRDGVVALTLTGLEPATEYHYAIEVDGVQDAFRRASFRTFPEGPASFTVAVAACARTGSNGEVFSAMTEFNPLLYVITGDFHYENIDSADYGGFRRAYQKTLTAAAQSALYRQAPIAYVWDDHDFGGNNSDASSAARETAQQAYTTYVPHYGLPAGDGAIYQAFSVGRVRFILTDTRSERNSETRPDGSKSLLGSEQLAWLKRELDASSRSHALVVWVSAVPWIGSFGDSWGGFPEERREIANFIAERRIDNLLMLSGDAHMVAIDDGTNTDYSDSKGAAFPMMHAGALDRPGSVKGGPYSEGAYPGAGQFGILDVMDDGKTLTVRLSGHTWERQELVSYTFIVPVAVAQTP